MELKNIYGKVVFQDGFSTIKETVENAVKQKANLSRADLFRANLSGANLSGANLSGADLFKANLSWANLSWANLSRADLFRANLSGANLFKADLFKANLSGANLSGADLPDFQVCPEEGDFIAFKKLANNHICKLKIPREAKRTSNLINRKCRCEFALVISIEDKDGNPVNEYYGSLDNSTIYKVGEIVKPDKYCDDVRLDCSNGIHFFITKKEAINWQ